MQSAEARIAALEAEIDATNAEWLKDRAEKAEAHIAALTEALRRYGDHVSLCAAKHKDEPCTCGFAAALKGGEND